MNELHTLINKLKIFLQGATIDQHKEEVHKRNFNFLRSFAITGVFTTCITSIYGQIMRNIVTFNTEFLILFIYCLLIFGMTFFIRKHTAHIIAILYLCLVPLMIIGILMGTFLDPYQPSITIMVFLCVLPLFILDKPWRIILFITSVAIVYSICCFMAKTMELFAADMIDLVLFYFIGISINCLILKDRMNGVEYAAVMRRLSERDALTDIYNRGSGEQKIKALVDQRQYGMFCIIDLDDFKAINDQYGHMVGDEVLKFVAMQLCESFQPNDIVLRMGGDEFAVFAIGVTDIASATASVKRLFRLIENPKNLKLLDCSIAISLGGSFFTPDDQKNFDALYSESDAALYKAKQGGKGTYYFN